VTQSFGFCGSRSLSSSFAPVVSGVVASLPAGSPVSVGCARGADELVRLACPSARVFAVASGDFGLVGPAAFARRSASMVRSLPPASWFVGFVASPCPANLVPSRYWVGGRPRSGSWSALAFAAGRPLSVAVVWCGADELVLPAWPSGWAPCGAWVPVSVAPWSGVALPCVLWVWSPATGLFD